MAAAPYPRPWTIYIVPMGPCNMNELEILAVCIRRQFACEVRFLENPGTPDYAIDCVRRQFNSNLILKHLVELCPAEPAKILGITRVDLFNPIFSFVFGEAQFGGKCAVVSLFRLQEKQGDQLPLEFPSVLYRIEKEAIHELGHTFGLGHCSDPQCVMSFSKDIHGADKKSDSFCQVCSALLSWFMEAEGTPPPEAHKGNEK